jgi:hypothetical protein
MTLYLLKVILVSYLLLLSKAELNGRLRKRVDPSQVRVSFHLPQLMYLKLWRPERSLNTALLPLI